MLKVKGLCIHSFQDPVNQGSFTSLTSLVGFSELQASYGYRKGDTNVEAE